MRIHAANRFLFLNTDVFGHKTDVLVSPNTGFTAVTLAFSHGNEIYLLLLIISCKAHCIGLSLVKHIAQPALYK